MTASVRYVLDAKPDSVDYIGRKVDKIGVVARQRARRTRAGAFSITFKAAEGLRRAPRHLRGRRRRPGREGRLPARAHGDDHARRRGPSARRSRSRSSGMGSPTYESVGAVLYDNQYAGAVSANTTRGVAVFKIRAAGEVGSALDRVRGIQPHRPVPEHGAVAGSVDGQPPAEVHGHEGRAASLRATSSGRSTSSRRSTRGRRSRRRRSRTDCDGDGHARLDERPDPLEDEGRPRPGLTPNAPVDLLWTTVVGNRVNCTGHVLELRAPSRSAGRRRLPTARSASPITVPDGLGGWHVVQVVQARQGHGAGAVLREAELRRRRRRS